MIDNTALFKIGYGLYVISCNDGSRDNAFICNTVVQVTDSPKRLAVTINKQNYSHDVIKSSGIMNVNCLNTDTPFEVFERLKKCFCLVNLCILHRKFREMKDDIFIFQLKQFIFSS